MAGEKVPMTQKRTRVSQRWRLAALAALTTAAGCNALFDIGSGTFAPQDAALPGPAPSDAAADAAPDALQPDALQPDAADAGEPCLLPRGGVELCVGGGCAPVDVPSPEPGGALNALASDGRNFYFAAPRFVYELELPSAATRQIGPRGTTPVFEMSAAGGVVFAMSTGSGGATSVRRQSAACDAGRFDAAFGALDAALFEGFEHMCNFNEYPELKWTTPLGEIVATSSLSAWLRVDDPSAGAQVVEYRVVGPDPASYPFGPPGRRLRLPARGTSLAVRGANIVYGYDGGAGVLDLAADAGRPLLGDAGSVVDVAASCTHAFLAESSRIVRAPLREPAPAALPALALKPGEPFAGQMAIDATHLWFVSGTRLYMVPLAAFDRPEGVSASAITPVGDLPTGASPTVAVTDDHVAVLGGTHVRVWKKYR